MGKCKPYKSTNLGLTGVVACAVPSVAYNMAFYNGDSVDAFVWVYDKATAATVGTDTAVLVYPVPAGMGVIIPVPSGLRFLNGIGLGASTALAGTGAPTASTITASILFDT